MIEQIFTTKVMTMWIGKEVDQDEQQTKGLRVLG